MSRKALTSPDRLDARQRQAHLESRKLRYLRLNYRCLDERQPNDIYQDVRDWWQHVLHKFDASLIVLEFYADEGQAEVSYYARRSRARAKLADPTHELAARKLEELARPVHGIEVGESKAPAQIFWWTRPLPEKDAEAIAERALTLDKVFYDANQADLLRFYEE